MEMINNNRIIKNTLILILSIIVVQCIRFNPLVSYASPYGILLIYSLINFILLISVYKTNTKGALTVAVVTPITGLIFNPNLLVLVPVVIISNVIFVLAFNYFKNYNEYLAAILSAILKWGFTYLTFKYFYPVINMALPSKLLDLYNMTELYTILIGCVSTVMVLKFVNETLKLGNANK